VDAQIVGLALLHKPWPSDAWVDGCTATVPLLKHTANILGGWDSSDDIATGYGLDSWGLIPSRGKRFFCIVNCPEWLWGPSILLFPVKQPVREADHSPCSSKVKNGGDFPPPMCLHGTVLI
jgi:hypothetical protein